MASQLSSFNLTGLPWGIIQTFILPNLKPKDLHSCRSTCKQLKTYCDKLLDLYISDFADGLTALACYFNFLKCHPTYIGISLNPRQGQTINFEFVTENPTIPSYKNALLGIKHTPTPQTKFVKMRQFNYSVQFGSTQTLSNDDQLFTEIRRKIQEYPGDTWDPFDNINCSPVPCHMSTSSFPVVVHKEDDMVYEHRPNVQFQLVDWIEGRMNPFKHVRDGKDRLVKTFLEPYWFESRDDARTKMANRKVRCGWNDSKCFNSNVCLSCYVTNLREFDKLKSVRTEYTCLLCTTPLFGGGLLCSVHFALDTELIQHVKQYPETAGINRRYPSFLSLVGWRKTIKPRSPEKNWRQLEENGSIELYWRNPKFECEQVFTEYKMIFCDDDDDYTNGFESDMNGEW